MNDEKNRVSKEEEYQFPQDEFVQGESTGRPSIETNEELEQVAKSAQREKIMKIYKRTRELIENRIVAFAIVVIILLLFAHFFFKSSSSNQAPIITQPVSVQPVVQFTQPSPVVLDQLSGIKQSANSMHDTIAQLQGQIQTLQSSVNQMEQSHQQYENVLIDLSKKLNEMQLEQDKLISEQVKKTVKAKSNSIVIPPVDFYTRAVVRNRAWVQSSDGENASITIGDSLRDYGKVVSIDPNTGAINTSSGRVINYAPGDQ